MNRAPFIAAQVATQNAMDAARNCANIAIATALNASRIRRGSGTSVHTTIGPVAFFLLLILALSPLLILLF